MLTVALAKGRLMGEALAAFRRAGAPLPARLAATRRLILEPPGAGLRFLVVKPADVPTYVEHGIADFGVVGRDVLLERRPDVYEPLDLGFGRCRLVVAAPEAFAAGARYPAGIRVGTKYPRVSRDFFEARGVPVTLIELTGSVELAPRVGLADLIVDVVETGGTLRENGLAIVEEVASSSARLIVNRASHKVRFEDVQGWVRRLRKGTRGAARRRR